MKEFHQENIWTRQRKLQDDHAEIIERLRKRFKALGLRLDGSDWKISAELSDEIISLCVRQVEIERELEGVTELVEGFDKINKRMEQLEQTLMDAGIGI